MTTESPLDQLAVRLAGTGGPILVGSRSEIGWPKSVVTSALPGSPSSSCLVDRHRSRQRTPRDQQKCASVPHFRRTSCSLQLRRVKWTSPRCFTHGFDSLHLGSDANL